jgi:hypothetical protein
MLALGGEGYGNVVHSAVQSRIFAASGRRTCSSNEADGRLPNWVGEQLKHALIEPAMLVAEPAAATPSIRCKRRIRHYPPANFGPCLNGVSLI